MRFFRLDAATTATLAALSFHLDANETAVFARELESIRTETVETEFPELKARSFLPLEPNVDPGAETLVWYEFTDVGMAKMLVNYADDLETAESYGTKQTSPIEAHGIAYMYSTQDLRAWRKTGRPLDRRKAEGAKKAIERRIEQVTALGHTVRNVPGFLKNANIPLLVTGINGDWDNVTTTPAQILADLHLIATAVWRQSRQNHTANTMILGSLGYQIVSTTVYSEFTGETILSVFLKGQTAIKEVSTWAYCDLADAESNGERIVCYEKNPSNSTMVVPLEFEQHPAQAENLMFKVPCEGRIGGAVVYKPLAHVYVDAIMDT